MSVKPLSYERHPCPHCQLHSRTQKGPGCESCDGSGWRIRRINPSKHQLVPDQEFTPLEMYLLHLLEESVYASTASGNFTALKTVSNHFEFLGLRSQALESATKKAEQICSDAHPVVTIKLQEIHDPDIREVKGKELYNIGFHTFGNTEVQAASVRMSPWDVLYYCLAILSKQLGVSPDERNDALKSLASSSAGKIDVDTLNQIISAKGASSYDQSHSGSKG